MNEIIARLKLSIRRYAPRKLAKNPEIAYGNFTSYLINSLIKKKNAKNYLEIGTQFGYTLEAVKFSNRIGIDPNPRHRIKNLPSGMKSLKITSDDFFDREKDISFDFIYIDGLHVFKQVYKDFINSANHLSQGGQILLDDVIPIDSFSADVNQTRAVYERNIRGNNSKSWQGDCFKLLHLIAKEMPFIEIKTIIYPGNAQALLSFIDTNRKLEFNNHFYERYNNLQFEEAFGNFEQANQLYHFEFGWNA